MQNDHSSQGPATAGFTDPYGREIDLRQIKPIYRALLRHLHPPKGEHPVTQFDLADPLGGALLKPGESSPICQKCRMWCDSNPSNPFLDYVGSEKPLVTFVFDSVSPEDDKQGQMGAGGWIRWLRNAVDDTAEITGVTSAECRFLSLTRCGHRVKGPVNLRSKGNYCRHFAIQDLRLHPPRIIIPIGSTALGLLCHKSNAQDWGGHPLTWRGWPDDWLTNPGYAKARDVMVGGQAHSVTGHPVFGPPPGPEDRILLFPLQAPRLIAALRNNDVTSAWAWQLQEALKLARQDVPMPVYDLPHYRLLYTRKEIVTELKWLIDHPGTLLCYDTETEGLYPFAGQKIVFKMFRYTRPDGEPVAFGFPWDYPEDKERGKASPLLPDPSALRPYVEKALSASILIGHNLGFDILFTFCNLDWQPKLKPIDEHGQVNPAWRESMRRLNKLADAAVYDTWHMAYTLYQRRGSLGLEMVTYDYVPELSGYEENMTILIELERKRMHPDEGGHYARCPQDKWNTHLKPYVLGDVETCYQARDAIQQKLDEAVLYSFPLASLRQRGKFRYYDAPGRAWLYEKIVSPAARVLIKMMGRGAYIDQKVLHDLETLMPKAVLESIGDLRHLKAVRAYIGEQKRADTHHNDFNKAKRWELDLESKEQLRAILFERMNLDIQRLTKNGRERYGEDPERWDAAIESDILSHNPHLRGTDLAPRIREEKLRYAALDKFTLNKLAVTYPEVRPLQNYRKIHKLYTTYVRPLRNYRDVSVGKKERTKQPHLCLDGLIHALFMITGTRSGRLSSRDPNLQQIPKEGYKSRPESAELNVKEMFVSRFGQEGCLYSADASQIELRLLAAASGDPTMIKAYFEGTDLHTLTTSLIFKVPYETFSKDHMKWLEEHGRSNEAKELKIKRDIGKTSNFLSSYGGGAQGLQNTLAAKQIYRELDECEAIIEGFFDSYPAIRDHLGYYKKFIEDHQVAVSIFGRVRVLQDAASSERELRSKALRAGCNHLIQSTASDMLLCCLCTVE
jgi:DNA polymerase I-like protein with 3'-5' exonuclease and polymerase domains